MNEHMDWIEAVGNTHLYANVDETGWQVADGGGWYPGIYASREAALLAPKLPIDELTHLVQFDCRSVTGQPGSYRPVTEEDLRRKLTELGLEVE